MYHSGIFLHGIEPLVKSDLPSDKTVLIFIGLLSLLRTHISASQAEKNMYLSDCMSALFLTEFPRTFSLATRCVKVRFPGKQAQRFLDHLLRL